MAAGSVLVVDDEEGIRVLCRVNLELAGFTVVEAEDGGAAVSAAREHKPDVIFLDLMLPVMDGWEVLETLRADEATANIPVVLLSARTSEEDQLRGWGAGVFDYLTKPFNPQLLVDRANQAVGPIDPATEAARRARAIEQLRAVQQLRRRH
jgi:DNA-binding response OmpR family regulator